MQIVRDLGGYTMGRSDLVRRAMSKKKQHVMEVERANFVYGNVEEGVPGCVAKGIPADVANAIYDTMMDFAKYAFNKSHAAAYAVVSYQTAYLRFYYPVEFMAALLTSVIDNPGKVTEYIYACRNMGIELLPPNVNEGEPGFSVSGKMIRYALTAIKNVGRPIIDAIVKERTEHGYYKNFQDFMDRSINMELNKRAVENFIKAGAFDCLGATRKQLMMVYSHVMDQNQHRKKHNLAGQMSLFDIVEEEEKENYQMKMPDCGEYEKEILLAFEKEVLGVYVSGHPLEEYIGIWKKNITATTMDFMLDEELNAIRLSDNSSAVVGGMLVDKKIKYTKNDKMMAFLTLEDLYGTVEVIVFPREYEKNATKLVEDNKIFVKGRVNAEEDKNGKLICESVTTFEEVPKKLWIKFKNMESFLANEEQFMDMIRGSDGKDRIVIYIEELKQMKELPPSQSVNASSSLCAALGAIFGEENIRLV